MSENISLSNIPFAVLCTDFNGIITDCNDQLSSLSGYSREQLIDKPVELLLPVNLTESHLKCRKSYVKTTTTVNHPRHILLLNQSEQNIPCTIQVIVEEHGYVIFLTEYLEAVNFDHEPTTKDVKQVLSGIDEAFWEWNIAKDVMFYSAHMMAILGYGQDAYTGPATLGKELVTKDVLKNIYTVFDDHLFSRTPCVNITFPIKTKLGITKWLCIVGKILAYDNGKPSKMFGSVKDITEKYQLVERLKEKNNYLVLAENLINSGHWRYDTFTGDLFWSTGIYSIHGLEPSQYKPDINSAINFYISEQRQQIKDQMKQAIELKQGFHFKSVVKHASGQFVKVEVLAEVEVDTDGEVFGVFGVCRDITKSEETLEKLRLLALVNKTFKVPIFFIDENDKIIYQDISPQNNAENTVLFNYINFGITDYIEYKRKAKRHGQVKQSSISFDKYNSVFDLSVTYEHNEGIFIWIVEDITEQYRQDQQQIISNRLALLGNTFGNVSHDINNVLGVALGATEMLELKFSQGERDISDYIERVKNAIDKGKSVTERLLAFTRKPTVKIVEFNPIQEIEDNQYLFKQLLLPTIDFSLDISNAACVITFPQGEFINILLNLVLNSQDAIQEQGLIGKINISANLTGENRLEIHVQDSGIGINNENISKIFDPFYSSKSVNKGNGIGLANVYSTIYKHNGSILVEGKGQLGGAHFTLIFNCKPRHHLNLVESNRKPKLNMAGKRVLILDDEQSIAEFVALYLENEGVITKYVTNKVDLISLLNNEQRFDIFITDMILPDMSGREAVDLVKVKFPNICIYSMSGYIAEEDNQWPYPVLRKPFNSKELCSFLFEQYRL
ncbi:hybrid sensor histidine kinase/response regulator [Cognaticolwellia mytili]|uniref:hybrid sensor histidine kinase/response regulator n=1 Tax=Cognaticolwellia mytili TaxID=1888913 RepID=UPI000A1752D6|nr:PAS domain-containing sensor histidine kinase [Cognaticolwellia mytili]